MVGGRGGMEVLARCCQQLLPRADNNLQPPKRKRCARNSANCDAEIAEMWQRMMTMTTTTMKTETETETTVAVDLLCGSTLQESVRQLQLNVCVCLCLCVCSCPAAVQFKRNENVLHCIQFMQFFHGAIVDLSHLTLTLFPFPLLLLLALFLHPTSFASLSYHSTVNSQRLLASLTSTTGGNTAELSRRRRRSRRFCLSV